MNQAEEFGAGLERATMIDIFEKIENCSGGACSPGLNTLPGAGVNSVPNGLDLGLDSQFIGQLLKSVDKGNPADNEEKEQKRKRAKRANEIYRAISRDAGLDSSFFDKFLIWSEYVEGKLSEEEYAERVREEVKKKLELLEN